MKGALAETMHTFILRVDWGPNPNRQPTGSRLEGWAEKKRPASQNAKTAAGTYSLCVIFKSSTSGKVCGAVTPVD